MRFINLLLAIYVCTYIYSISAQEMYPEEFRITVTAHNATTYYPIIVCKAVGNIYTCTKYSPDSIFYHNTDPAYIYSDSVGSKNGSSFYLPLQHYKAERLDIDTILWGKYKFLIGLTDGEQDENGEYILVESKDSIYFDLTTTNYWGEYGVGGGSPDMHFKYDWNSRQFQVVSPVVRNVPNGTTVAIWDNYYNPGAPSRVTWNFRPATPGFFDVSGYNGQIKLSWLQDCIPLTYKIFRKINGGNYSNVANVTNSSWFDPDLGGIGGSMNTSYYYIVALNQSQQATFYSDATDVDSINFKYFMNKTANTTTDKRCILFDNYPNPFNPSTSIQYQISSPSFVRIKVYNMLGQEIRTLVNEHKNIGSYSIIWNGTDNTGSKVSSGIYLYQIKAGEYIETKRMVLMK